MGYRLGIDLGTTFTAAAVEEDGRAEIVQLGDHAPQIPSAVFVREDGALLVGEAAVRKGAVQPDRLEREFKRRLGDRVPYVLGGQEFTAEQLTARLLRTVVDEVERRYGGPPERLALTHPANWGAHRRSVLLEAVRLAGVGEVTTLSEPAAAAVHFASTERAQVGDAVAVYDLGGGTFDAAVLRKSATEFELLGTPNGVEQLGGVDFDDKIFRYVLRSLGDSATALDPDEPAVVAALVRLRRECTDAKEALSKDSETAVPVALPGMPPTSVHLSRVEFEDMIRPDVEQTVRCMRRALESASLSPEDVRTVVLVGGSARIPLVAEALGHEFGRPVMVSTQPKLAVALGAALLAGGVLPSPPDLPEPDPEEGPGGRGGKGTGELPPKGTAPGPGGDRPRPDGRRRPGPPVRQPTRRPARVAQLAAAVGGLLLVAVLLALVAPSLLAPGPPDGVTVNAGPAGDDDRFSADLGIPLTLTGLGGTEVRAKVLGIPISRDAVENRTASVRLGTISDLLAGPVRFTVTGGGQEPVVVEPTGGGLGSAIRWLPLLLMLFAIAYTESLLRGVRRRRTARRADIVGMGAVGAVAGLALVLAAWTLAERDLGLLNVLSVLAVSAGAGGLLAVLQAERIRGQVRPVRDPATSP
ncbi:Hsp70 family protein [Blastococcus sp. CT_GayMR19]|uniref:Hsp70 family protein n=1 Tax=Blastococcus sp. CT_GayMR19 TaxID=2559608 RepID=UPI001431C823|nr:Hsp70 family protein [Blastococcus sp. CT_GayMR19]